jgi:hypothetical protein
MEDSEYSLSPRRTRRTTEVHPRCFVVGKSPMLSGNARENHRHGKSFFRDINWLTFKACGTRKTLRQFHVSPVVKAFEVAA